MSSLRLALLGSPQIWLDSQLLTFESRKAVALLTYLVITQETHSRASLAALFWPESDQKRARGALRYTLSILRRQLGDGWLHSDQQSLSWQPEDDLQFDVSNFRTTVSAWVDRDLEEVSQTTLTNCRQELETAVSLYRDDFMMGFGLRDCLQFDEWVFFQTENLRQLLAEALQILIKLCAQQEEWEKAINYARRWLQLDQLHEPAHQALMRFYTQNGQWSAAVRQYESCVSLLENELGVEPMAETVTLYKQIRHNRPINQPASSPSKNHPPVLDKATETLLEKVRHFWVEGVLDQTSEAGELIPLTISPYQQAIQHPWQDILGRAVTEQQAPSLPNCLAYYQQSKGALLILGSAGAGKTITLIQLARDLLQDRDKQQPLPVILNLSTWAESQTSISDWVIAELMTKYQIPRRFGRQWLDTGQLVLLLDGLDELPKNQRPLCITAINTLRESQGLNSIVVCCRQIAYEQAGIKLNLNGAVLIQPLQREQIHTYLENRVAPQPLLVYLAQHDTLLEMAQSPLTLSILAAAYDVELEQTLTPTPIATMTTKQTEMAVTDQLFTAYVRHMLQRRRQSDDYTLQQTTVRLAWLARQMQTHNQTIFLIEAMQPSWLPSQRWRWFYILFSRIVGGFIFGIVTWLFIVIGQERIPELEVHVLEWINNTFQVPAIGNNILPVLLLNSGLGLLIGLLDGFLFRRRGETAVISRRIGWQHLIAVSATAFLLTTLFIALFDPFPLALFVGLLQSTSFVLAFGYLERGQSFRTEVRPVEALGWSWKTAVRGLAVGFLFGVLSGSLMNTLYTPLLGKSLFFGSLIIFTMFGGLQHGRLQITTRPNQGTWLSVKNGSIAAIVFATLMTATFWLIQGKWPGWYEAVLYGLIAGLIYGGSDVLRHLTIRAILSYTGHIPWRYVHFLDFTVNHILLRRVGGGYIFRHRLLQQHFNLNSTSD